MTDLSRAACHWRLVRQCVGAPRRNLSDDPGVAFPMKSVAVRPGRANSVHLAELPMPRVTQIPDGRGVLVKVLKVGVDATDREINDALYGNAPPGDKYLVLGHESFGVVEEVGPSVRRIKPGDYVTATVRRPGGSIYDLIGTND